MRTYLAVTGMVDRISQAVDSIYHSVGVFVDLHIGINSYYAQGSGPHTF